MAESGWQHSIADQLTPSDGRGGRGPLARLAQTEGARSSLIAVVSTVVVFVAIAVAIGSSPRWPRVRDQFFSADDAREALPAVWRGFLLNIRLWLIAIIAIPPVALALATMRSLRGPAFFPIRALAVAYIDILRGIPALLLVTMLGFGVPALQLPGVTNSAIFWGTTALVLSYAAYTAEIFRSGIDSVPESQRSSARALGLTQAQALRYAIWPQAVRNVVPSLMNLVVALQKDVTLVSVLGIRDAVQEANIYKARTFNYTGFVVAALLFLALSVPLTRFVDWYAERDRGRRAQVGV